MPEAAPGFISCEPAAKLMESVVAATATVATRAMVPEINIPLVCIFSLLIVSDRCFVRNPYAMISKRLL
jgi:hypothetical protein